MSISKTFFSASDDLLSGLKQETLPLSSRGTLQSFLNDFMDPDLKISGSNSPEDFHSEKA